MRVLLPSLDEFHLATGLAKSALRHPQTRPTSEGNPGTFWQEREYLHPFCTLTPQSIANIKPMAEAQKWGGDGFSLDVCNRAQHQWSAWGAPEFRVQTKSLCCSLSQLPKMEVF
jgi:hypothetical protein